MRWDETRKDAILVTLYVAGAIFVVFWSMFGWPLIFGEAGGNVGLVLILIPSLPILYFLILILWALKKTRDSKNKKPVYSEDFIRYEPPVRTCSYAKASYILGLLAIVSVGVGFVFGFHVEFLAGIAFCLFRVCIVLAPVSAAISLVKIGLSKGQLRGIFLAVVGICESMACIICFFIIVITSPES